MRIIQINNSDETYTPTASGAIATHIWEIGRAARSTGVQTLVLTRDAAQPPMPERALVFTEPPRLSATVAGRWARRIDRRILGWRDSGHRRHARRVVETVKRHGLQTGAFLLHNDPELAVVLRQQFPRARLFHHFHNPVQCRGRFLRRFRLSVDGVFAVSSYVADEVRRIYGLPLVKVVHNGVDLERFSPSEKPPGPKVSLNFLGRTGVEKAPDLFLKAALRLARDGMPLRVQLVGANHWGRWEADEFQAQLSRLCDEIQAVGGEIVKAGHVARAQIPEMLRSADIHVLPSRWEEPCALSLLEGMATGLAVVASRTGGTAEILGQAGRLFERDAECELYEHLRDLTQDPLERGRLARAARERAMRFTWLEAWRKLALAIF